MVSDFNLGGGMAFIFKKCDIKPDGPMHNVITTVQHTDDRG
jgi:hypothetical protein